MRCLVACLAAVGIVAGTGAPASAQESSSYSVTESTVNAGGHPRDGTFMTSASFRITFDAVGATLVGREMSGPSFRAVAGFVNTYPPPGPVGSVHWTEPHTLSWTPEKSAGDYNVYRDLLSRLPSGGFGTCLAHDIAGVEMDDAAAPPGGDGYFYLVTVENRLEEEGTKGWTSAGSERSNVSPCP